MTWASEAKRYREAELALYDDLPLVASCAICGWSHTGTALSGRQEAVEHRLQEHPEIKPRRKSSRHLSSFRQAALSDEEVSDIDRARRKRAKLIGINLD